MSADADESVSTCWLDSRAPTADVDEASRDSGICLMDATSADDDTYHDFSVLSVALSYTAPHVLRPLQCNDPAVTSNCHSTINISYVRISGS